MLDDVGKGDDEEGILEGMYNRVMEQMDRLASQGAGDDSADTLFRSSMNAFVRQLNKTATDLEELEAGKVKTFNTDVDRANEILDRIRDLNTSIRRSQMLGDTPLQQEDERNVLLDELSKYMEIDVTYTTEVLFSTTKDARVTKDDGSTEVQKVVDREITVEKLVVTTGTEPKRDLINGVYVGNLRHRETSSPFFEDEGYYDLDITALVNTRGEPIQMRFKDEGAVKNNDMGAIVDRDGQEKLLVDSDGNIAEDGEPLTFDSMEEAQELADALTEQAKEAGTGTEFRVHMDQAGQITIHEYGTKIYGLEEVDQALKDMEDNQLNTFSAYYDHETGEVTQTGCQLMEVDGHFEIHYVSFFQGEVGLKDTELGGTLLADREFLTEKGIFSTEQDLARDSAASTKHGVQYYKLALDVLANNLANSLNTANTLQDELIYRTNEDGAFVNLNGEVVTDRSQYVLKPEYQYYNGGVLLSNDSNGNDAAGITAANISISRNWANGSMRVLRTTQADPGSTQNDNLNYIKELLEGRHVFYPNNSGIYDEALSQEQFFAGSYQDLMTNHIAATLAEEQHSTDAMLDSHTAISNDLYVSRDAVVGVDLNDEAMNLIKFQSSYSAACRLMTTYDQMLDRLINGMAV